MSEKGFVVKPSTSTSRLLRDFVAREIVLGVTWSLLAFLISKELYHQWGPMDFLDKGSTQVNIAVSKKLFNKECFLPLANILLAKAIPYRYSSQEHMKSYYSYYMLKNYGPIQLWNTYVAQEYLRMRLGPSPINKFRIDVWFINLPFDGEVALDRKLF